MNKQWTMPEWMEPYRNFVLNTGGNPIEELMNDQVDARINLPRAVLCACTAAEIGMLARLQSAGLLAPANDAK